MSEILYGPKRLAKDLDIDERTAKNILTAIADVEVTDGVWRLTEEGYRKWLADRKEAARIAKQAKQDGNVARKETALGSKTPVARWSPDI